MSLGRWDSWKALEGHDNTFPNAKAPSVAETNIQFQLGSLHNLKTFCK